MGERSSLGEKISTGLGPGMSDLILSEGKHDGGKIHCKSSSATSRLLDGGWPITNRSWQLTDGG